MAHTWAMPGISQVRIEQNRFQKQSKWLGICVLVWGVLLWVFLPLLFSEDFSMWVLSEAVPQLRKIITSPALEDAAKICGQHLTL